MKTRFIPFTFALPLLVLFLLSACSGNPEDSTTDNSTLEPVEEVINWQDFRRKKNDSDEAYFTDRFDSVLFDGQTFEFAYDFHNGFAVVGKTIDSVRVNGAINRKGELVVPYEFPGFFDNMSEGYFKWSQRLEDCFCRGYVDTTGKIVIPQRFTDSKGVLNGMVKLEYKGKGWKRKWGIMSMEGDTLLPFEYSDIWSWKEGYAKISTGEYEGERWGYLDSTLKIVIPPKYKEARQFEYGMAAVKKGRKYGFINAQDSTVIPFDYDEFMVIVDETTDYTFDPLGNTSRSNYRVVLEEGWIIARKGKKWGYIDKKGEEVVPFEYEYLDLPKNNKARFEKGGQKGYWNFETMTEEFDQVEG